MATAAARTSERRATRDVAKSGPSATRSPGVDRDGIDLVLDASRARPEHLADRIGRTWSEHV